MTRYSDDTLQGSEAPERATIERDALSVEHEPRPSPELRIAGSADVGELAILGGQPAFSEVLCVGRPNMPDRNDFLARIDAMLDSSLLTNLGPFSREFEERVARISGHRFAVATCNATVGLELGIRALGMTGDVIVPSFTFVATVHALWRQGIRPVFCDVDPHTHCLDPDCLASLITPQTTGILAVNLWGNRASGTALRRIADRHGLRLLFDSSHSFGCNSSSREDIGVGDAEVFSFHATKLVHSFEGGAIVTDDRELADRLRLMINFGFADEDDVKYLGTNGKMSEASAAMGLTSLESMARIVEHNRQIHHAYEAGLADVPGVELMQRNPRDQHTYHYIVTEVDEAKSGLTRDELVSALRLENVLSRRYFHPGCHRMQPYHSLWPEAGRELTVTEELARRVMVLPTGLAVDQEAVAVLTGCIAAMVRQAGAVRQALSSCTNSKLPAFLTQTSDEHS